MGGTMIKKPEITLARQILKQALDQDQNEADTRRGIERVLEGVCGLDPLENLSRESAPATLALGSGAKLAPK
jgi:hypothetical protein